ncbi:MAG: transporter substrate-binding domain-containing protein [Butyrivibrio sp.]|nr:transporter substrate-binding domain-containing protein [Butyrivibrio sp.]
MALTMGTMALTGCGSSGASDSAEASEKETTTETEEATEETTEEAAEETTEETTEEAAEETSEEMGPVLSKIKESGKLIVGTASGYPPYEFVDITSVDQTVIGVDMELAQSIADELGVTLEIQDMTFTALLAAIPAGKVDMAIAGVSPTDERRETMDFSDSYLFADQAVIINKTDAEKYKTFDDLKGATLAAQKSTTQEKLVQELLPDNTLVSLEQVPECILELKNGKVDGVVIESIVGEQYILADDTLQFAEANFDRQKEAAVVFDKGNEDLIEIVNEVIKENQDAGNFEKWVDEYSKIVVENAQ